MIKAHFVYKNNQNKGLYECLIITDLYETEAAKEGINSDIAFAQMCLETGFLRFGGVVSPEQNNFCGLGTINSETPGASFSFPQDGVRAHIQHLKAYANTKALLQTKIDPRFHLVQRGSAPYIDDLTGKWAADPLYHQKIRSLILRMIQHQDENPKIANMDLRTMLSRFQTLKAGYHPQEPAHPRTSFESHLSQNH